MPSQQQIDPHLLAIEINALRVAEIATLRRECEFWRQRCLHLEAVVNLPPRRTFANSAVHSSLKPAAVS